MASVDLYINTSQIVDLQNIQGVVKEREIKKTFRGVHLLEIELFNSSNIMFNSSLKFNK